MEERQSKSTKSLSLGLDILSPISGVSVFRVINKFKTKETVRKLQLENWLDDETPSFTRLGEAYMHLSGAVNKHVKF